MKREQLERYLDNPNVRRFLDYIAQSEGTNEHGYRTAFGGGVIEDLSRHPGKRYKFTQTDGKANTTTAAGRYQFLSSTWNRLSNKYGFSDFGPESQDLGAIALLADAGALDDVVNGDFTSAIEKSGATWASLPSSPYAQPKRSWSEAAAFLGDKVPPSVSAKTAQPESSPTISSPTTQMDIDSIYGIAPKYQEPSRDESIHTSINALYGFNPEMTTYLNEAMPSISNKVWLDNYINGLIENA